MPALAEPITNPTFEQVFNKSRNGQGKYILMPDNSVIRCRCTKKKQLATIDFDLYTDSFNRDLSPKMQDVLRNEHRAYILKHFEHSGYRDPVNCTFGNSSIRFDVLIAHAEEWFGKLYHILEDKKNLKRVTLDLPVVTN